MKKEKNFFPTLILAMIFWGLWGWVIYSLAPTNNLVLIAFYLLLFLAAFLTSALIFANSKIGAIIALLLVLILNFLYFKIGNILNLSLLTAIFLLLVIYLKSKS